MEHISCHSYPNYQMLETCCIMFIKLKYLLELILLVVYLLGEFSNLVTCDVQVVRSLRFSFHCNRRYNYVLNNKIIKYYNMMFS